MSEEKNRKLELDSLLVARQRRLQTTSCEDTIMLQRGDHSKEMSLASKAVCYTRSQALEISKT